MGMNEREREALRANHLALIADLDVKDISPFLYQEKMIDSEQYEELCESKLPRRKLCGSFLLMINKPSIKCTFDGLLQALRYKDTYSFLANKLESSFHDTEQSNEDTNECDDMDATEGNRDIILEPVRKVDVFTSGRRKKISRLAHELKRLTHDGRTDQFAKLTGLINKKFRKQKFNLNLPAMQKMELADMRFTALEAEASAKRVKYDVSLCGSDVFKNMVEVIPFTTNPRVSSMTYLARFGSSIGMSDGTDPGLAYLQYAKQHAEYVTPCKDTGMVFYIEVNLLTQKYEATPNDDLKRQVLETTQYAMSQFESEDEEVRNDYQRMLMLKMVFCYLGIGLFGKKIQNIQTTPNDIDAAKNCIDFMEKPDVWNGLEKRRKMLFLLAKTEYYRQIGSSDLAKMHAKESRKLARQNGWNVELLNIEHIVKELEERKTEARKMVCDDDFVQNLIDDLMNPEDNYCEDDTTVKGANYSIDILKETSLNGSDILTNTTSDPCFMNNLKTSPFETSTEVCETNILKKENSARGHIDQRMDLLKQSTCRECGTSNFHRTAHCHTDFMLKPPSYILTQSGNAGKSDYHVQGSRAYQMNELKGLPVSNTNSEGYQMHELKGLSVSNTNTGGRHMNELKGLPVSNTYPEGCQMNELKGLPVSKTNSQGYQMNELKEVSLPNTNTWGYQMHELKGLSVSNTNTGGCQMNELKGLSVSHTYTGGYQMNELKGLPVSNTYPERYQMNELKEVSLPNTNTWGYKMNELKGLSVSNTYPEECQMDELKEVSLPNTNPEECQMDKLKEVSLPNTNTWGYKMNELKGLPVSNTYPEECQMDELKEVSLPNTNPEECQTNELKGLSLSKTNPEGYQMNELKGLSLSKTNTEGYQMNELKGLCVSNTNTEGYQMNELKEFSLSSIKPKGYQMNELKEFSLSSINLEGYQMSELKGLSPSNTNSEKYQMNEFKCLSLLNTNAEGYQMNELKELSLPNSNSHGEDTAAQPFELNTQIRSLDPHGTCAMDIDVVNREITVDRAINNDGAKGETNVDCAMSIDGTKGDAAVKSPASIQTTCCSTSRRPHSEINTDQCFEMNKDLAKRESRKRKTEPDQEVLACIKSRSGIQPDTVKVPRHSREESRVHKYVAGSENSCKK